MITLKIDGMTCDHCVKAVTEALSAIDGVDRVVEVSLERGEALVDGRPDPVRLVAAVKDEGYEARLA